jgi:hypothetical protein
MNVLVLEPPRLGLYSPSISKLTSSLMQTSAVSALEAHSCFPRTNPVIVLIQFPQLAPGCAVSLPQVLLHAVLSSKYVASHEGISRAWRAGHDGNENESLRLPHPCALVAARHLLNTTWSLKLPYKAAWEYRDENILFVRCDWRGLAEMEAAQGQTEEAGHRRKLIFPKRRRHFGQPGLGSASSPR